MTSLLLIACLAVAQSAADPFEKIARVEHAPISEMSGIVKSATYEDVWWVHNDSGDEARLFAIDSEGKVIQPTWLKGEWKGHQVLGAFNVDWEDLAISDGRIYIGEVGNNGNARRDLGIYVLNEPDPRAVPKTRYLKYLPLRYPDQEAYPAKKWHFDCESMFASEGKLYFLTKHRVAGQIGRGELGTKLYRLDSEHTDKENVLTLIEKSDRLAMPTAAGVSPDGKLLAVLTVRALWVFEKPAEGDKWLSSKARVVPIPVAKTKQAEAVCWDDSETLRVTNEQRDLFLVRLSALKPLR
jgi:hypothetical protein